MKKIKMSASWDSSENITKRLLKQFSNPSIDLSEIEFVYDDSYDVIVFLNHVNSPINENSRAFVFPHEPSWSGSHQKNFLNVNATVFGFDKDLYTGNCLESIAHTFYGGRGPWVDSLEFWNYNNLVDKIFKKEKNISSSVTTLNYDYGNTCLYPQRFKIHNLINELSFIDDFATNNKPRLDSLEKYKFNISVENEYQKNWITEKFYDSVLTDTIPIYFGCKNIKEIFPEDGYILINDINNLDEIRELFININENSDEIYKQKINGLRQIKKRYFDEFNLLKIIIKL
jgi:hypothetical protein